MEPPRVPIKSSEEVSAMLPSQERAKVEALEEYRLEVRKRLESAAEKARERSSFWREMILAPGLLVLLTVLLSGYIAPKVLEQSQKTQRAFETTVGLLDEIALQTAEMQVAIDTSAAAIDTYWSDAARANSILAEVAVKRNIGEITPAEFDKQNELLENDRSRIHNQMEQASREFDTQVRRFSPWLNRTRVKIAAIYLDTPERKAVDQALERVAQSATRAEAALEKKTELYDAGLNREIENLKQLRSQMKASALSPDQYRERALVIINRLRVLESVPGPSHALDNGAVGEALAKLQLLKVAH
jgi:hypothetical protein